MNVTLRTALMLTVSAILSSASFSVLAVSEIASARVEIVPAINISEENEIDFGRISNVDGTCIMSAGGSLNGSAGMECTGSQTPGEFLVSGLSGAVLSISVTQGSIDGVTFNPTLPNGSSITLIGGSQRVTILGSIQLADAIEGNKNITYTFTANYQ